MKAHAIGGRDKPKDSYDFCYCLDNFPEEIRGVAGDWKMRAKEENIIEGIEILTEKFDSVESFGPQQVVEFYSEADKESSLIHARRSYELMQNFLGLLSPRLGGE
jgi:hypothetical protein